MAIMKPAPTVYLGTTLNDRLVPINDDHHATKEPKTIDRLYLRAGAGLPPSTWREMATAEVPQSVVQHTTHTVEPFIRAQGRLVMFEIDGRNLVYRIGLDGTPSFMQHRSDAPPMGVDPGSAESLGNAARAWMEWEGLKR